MTARLRPFVFLIAISVCAIVVYDVRIRREMVDFITWRRAVVRGLDAEPLYRPEDGHYQFKYLPMFALLMAPFGWLDPETGKMVWFAIEVVLLVALVRWSVAALPERRLSQRTLVWFAIVLMAKFYAHELLLGQTNLLLAVLILSGLLAVQNARPMTAGGLIGLAVFVKPYALILFPWLLVTQRWPAAAMAAGVVAIGLLLPSVVYGWSGNLDLLGEWLRTVRDSTASNLLNNDNVSIAAMWAKWVGPGSLATGCASLTIVGAAGIGDRRLAAKAGGGCARIPRERAADAPHSPPLAAGLGLRAVTGHAGRRLPRGSLAGVHEILAVGVRRCARADESDDVRHHGPRTVRPVHGAVPDQRVRPGHRRGPGSRALG